MDDVGRYEKEEVWKRPQLPSSLKLERRLAQLFVSMIQ